MTFLRTHWSWFLAPALLAVMIALNPPGGQTYLMGDFRAFYCAGSAVAHGADPYREEPLRGCEATAGPPAEPAFLRPVALPAPLPPYALLLFVPFALLPFPVAAVCYGVLLIASMTLAVALLARVTGASSTVLNLSLAAITATVTYYVGQPMPLVFAALAAAALFARRGRWAAASVCAALASIEPHVALAAIVGLFALVPRSRIPLLLCGAGLAAASIGAVGLPVCVEYVREVVPAHALANAYEWQFSLTSVLTSLGAPLSAAVRWGELEFAAMLLLGVAVAQRLRKSTGDDAVMIVVPPAFAVFGGVHVHFQQIAIAFPAILYVAMRHPRVRTAALGGLAFAMIPWNVMGASVLAGFAPLLAGGLAGAALGRRAGSVIAVICALVVSSVVVLAALGLGPAAVHFVPHAYGPQALAELSWGDFSRAALMRPSVMMQWLRLPTLAGLACGLLAIAVVAYGDALRRARPAAMLPWACCALAVGWLAALAMRLPRGDGDLLWQRWLGDRVLHEHAIPRALGAEAFAAQGAPWTPHEWLFSTALAWTGGHGASWIVPLACALAFGVALATVVLRCRDRGVSHAGAAVAVLFCALAAMQSFGARAQVLGWACLGLVAWLLEIEGPWAWAAVPVTVLWANVHASAFLAPALAVLLALSALLRERSWAPAVRRSTALAGACAAATLATPFGFDLVRYATALLTSPIRASIGEWGATGIGSAAFAAGALPIVLLLAVFGARASSRDRLLAAAFTVLLFGAVRNVPVFAIVAAPIALAAFPRSRTTAPSERSGAFAWTALAAVVACGIAVSGATWRYAPLAGETLPLGSARALLAEARTPPRVFCEDFAWCSVFLDRPARFFMDGRCDPYPPRLWREYREVIDGNRRWAAILDGERIDAVLVRRNGALDSLLAERGAIWRRLADDRVSAVYVRRPLLAARR
jgi:hypothetical protein